MAHIAAHRLRRSPAHKAEERAFLHDILNTAGGVLGLAELLRDGSLADAAELAAPLAQLAGRLVEEIRTQQILLAAADGDLAVMPAQVDPWALLQDLQAAYCAHELGTGRGVVVVPDVTAGGGTALHTDRRILRVVLEQMLKSALTACPWGAAVRLGCRPTAHGVKFIACTPGAIVAPTGEEHPGFALAQRLAARYLRAHVAIVAGIEDTTFLLRCPRQMV